MDTDKIEQLIQVVKGAQVSEISLESNGSKVKIRKGQVLDQPPAGKAPTACGVKKAVKKAEAASLTESSEPKEAVITAPMVGIFHSFNGNIRIGSMVQTGQVVGSIESMKLMNDVAADSGGTVVEVLVEDGMPVEYGQALLRLKCD